MNDNLKKRLEKQHYSIIGQHSGVKLCHWMKQSLIHKRYCYKQQFYGIQSHRCLQMTPTINQCTHSCLFCWRYQGFTETGLEQYDDPKIILEESIKAQRKLITGFKGDSRCDLKKWEEANNPNMVACSLSGEPTLYPKLDDFFSECHKKNMTTFLVTNGTKPTIIDSMEHLPKQLYVSIIAPNVDVYQKLSSPFIKNGWEKIKETLKILPSIKTRTVIRHTLVNGWNMNDKYIKQYAKLIEKANPLFVEPKGYVFVGSSRKRLTIDQMPSHDQIKDFSMKLAKEIGYYFIDEKQDSRVCLLSSKKNVERIVK
jgi:tRNA wybutosine-synthesizing protein 1